MGRHSAPDDYDDDASAVLSAPPAAANRPLPGRHSHGAVVPTGGDDPVRTTGPIGLDVIETAMTGDTEVAGPEAEPAPAERTDQIVPIVDPVLDEPLPVAVTTVIPPVVAPVVDGASPRPTPHPQPGPAPAGHAETAPSDAPVDAVAAKAAGKAAKVARAEAKSAAKSAAKAARAERSAAGTDTKAAPAQPDARVSDFALLRSDSAARARVIAAIVVPFLLYVGVLLVLDEFELRTALIWIWVPLISAGVVAGLLLDLAHRAAAARAVDALDGPPPS